MLHLYSDVRYVPEGMEVVRFNDFYFNRYVHCIKDTEFVRKAIEQVERGKYFSERKFLSQFDEVGVMCFDLSTGCKSILNAYTFSDKCVDTVECGNNAVEFLLDNLRDGNLLIYPKVFLYFPENKDICVNGKIIRGWNACMEVCGVESGC